jgi:23S rRNA (adenine2503-C2)-methyltransferase
VLSDPAGLAIAKERITISTVGRVDGIRRLRALGWRRINLAVSLNAPNDEIRSKIMPINRAEPMARLREALIEFPMRRCGPIMLEYVLIPAVNDRREHALELAEFCRPIKGCVAVARTDARVREPVRGLASRGRSVLQTTDDERPAVDGGLRAAWKPGACA